MKERV